MNTSGEKDAETAGILIHGRGATAESTLGLKNQIKNENTYYIAPQAETREWYPNSFLKPIGKNQPELDQAWKQSRTASKNLRRKNLKEKISFYLDSHRELVW